MGALCSPGRSTPGSAWADGMSGVWAQPGLGTWRLPWALPFCLSLVSAQRAERLQLDRPRVLEWWLLTALGTWPTLGRLPLEGTQAQRTEGGVARGLSGRRSQHPQGQTGTASWLSQPVNSTEPFIHGLKAPMVLAHSTEGDVEALGEEGRAPPLPALKTPSCCSLGKLAHGAQALAPWWT